MKRSMMKISLLIAMIAGQSMVFAMIRQSDLQLTNNTGRQLYILGFELVEAGWTYNTYKPITSVIEVPNGETVVIHVDKEAINDRWLYHSADRSKLQGYLTAQRPLPADRSFLNLPKRIEEDRYIIPPFTKSSAEVTEEQNRLSADYVAAYNAAHPRVSELSWVRRGDLELSGEEQNFLINRARVTKPAILALIKARIEPIKDENVKRQLLQKVDDWQLPCISLCFSGGGLRAMQSSIGFLQGLRDANLLDTTTYCAALSGSTWSLLKWLEQGGNPGMLDGVKEQLQAGVVNGLIDTASIGAWTLYDLYVKGKTADMDPAFLARHWAEHNTAPSATNVWGMYLAKMLFPNREDKYAFTLSSLAGNMNAAHMPLPICTAVSSIPTAHDIGDLRSKSWVEFTPYTTGVIEGAGWFSSPGYIPTWAFGRKYAKARLTRHVASIKQPKDQFLDHAVAKLLPDSEYYSIEPSCTQLLGMFGSAMTVRNSEMEAKGAGFVDGIKGYLKAGETLFGVAAQVTGSTTALQIAGGANMMRRVVPGVAEAVSLSGLRANNFYDPAQPDFELRDAGIAFNLPLPPLLNPKRNINMMIILDASGDLHEKGKVGFALKEFRLYALHHKIQIPKELRDEKELDVRLEELNLELEQKKIQVAVFGAMDNPQEMTVIYVPTILNKNLAGFEELSPTKAFSTFQFKYTQAESEQLCAYNRALARQVAPFITQLIEQKSQALNRNK